MIGTVSRRNYAQFLNHRTIAQSNPTERLLEQQYDRDATQKAGLGRRHPGDNFR